MHKIFVYGTLKQGFCREGVMKGNFLGKTRTLSQYKLNDLGGFPGLTPSEIGKAIEGELWEVDDDCLRTLDMIEGHPRLFRRDSVELEHPKGKDAEAYFWQGRDAEDCGTCWTRK